MQHINDMIGRFFKYEEFRNKRILSEKYISLKMFTVIHYSSFDPIFPLFFRSFPPGKKTIETSSKCFPAATAKNGQLKSNKKVSRAIVSFLAIFFSFSNL